MQSAIEFGFKHVSKLLLINIIVLRNKIYRSTDPYLGSEIESTLHIFSFPRVPNEKQLLGTYKIFSLVELVKDQIIIHFLPRHQTLYHMLLKNVLLNFGLIKK